MKKQPPENPILTVVKSAQPVNKHGQPDRFADRVIDRLGIVNYRLVKIQPVRNKESSEAAELQIPLFMNGCCLIDYEIVSDDGIIENRYFVIIGKLQNGRDLPPIKVQVPQFPSLSWPLQWGNQLIVAPGNGNKDNARAAIQILSGDVRIEREYRHTGWRHIDGEWHYLSGSGPITADGLNDKIRVELDQGHMQRYRLLAPSEETKHHARLLLDFLDISPKNPAIGAALVCAICRAPLGEAAEIDFSLFFAGLTGSLKSSVAVLAQGFFGDFVEVGMAGRFPGSFIDSGLDLTIKAHQAKDAIFVVDEFNPNSLVRRKAEELHDKAEFLFRSAGNRSGRGTRTSEHTAREARYPRGLVFATGEDMPQSASLLGRMLIVELKPGDIDKATLTHHQTDAKEGKYRQAMAAYLRWLAPRLDDMKISLPKKIQTIIEDANKGAHAGGFGRLHLRHAGTYASMLAGFDVFIDFLVNAEIISEVRVHDLYESTAETLRSLIKAQSEYQQQNDEVRVFRELLQACFVSGKVHVGCHLSQGAPKIHPHQWGWRANEKDGELIGRGEFIGWINEIDKQLWLNPSSTFKAVQLLANAQCEAFTIKKPTLWKRLMERNILLETEVDKASGRSRGDVYRAVDSSRKRVLIFSTSFINENDKKGDI